MREGKKRGRYIVVPKHAIEILALERFPYAIIFRLHGLEPELEMPIVLIRQDFVPMVGAKS